MRTRLEYSETESQILGLKIGRCNSDFFESKTLATQIQSSQYDLCRLKVPAEDEMAVHRLNQMGMPAFFSGSIRRYSTRIDREPEGNYNYTDLIWEKYDGSQDQLLRDMLVGTWGTYPLGYYRTPFLSTLINKEAEIESVFQFYKKSNNPNINPNNGFVFIKHGDNYIGFFALNIINGNLESHIGGILEPYRKGGYFLDKLRYIKHFCIDNKLERFIFGARNENAQVQRIFQHVGFQPTGSENVFHIPSLLNYSQRPILIKETLLDKGKEYAQLLNECINYAGGELTNKPNQSFTYSLISDGNLPISNLRFSMPVFTSNEILVVVQSDTSIGYFRAYN